MVESNLHLFLQFLYFSSLDRGGLHMIRKPTFMNANNNYKNSLKIIIAVLIMVFIVIQSLRLGRYSISWGEIFTIIGELLFNWENVDLTRPDVSVFYYIRLPRIILALLVGA